jgi:hypothetical protein
MRTKPILGLLVVLALTGREAVALTVAGRVVAEPAGGFPPGTLVTLLPPDDAADRAPVAGMSWTASRDGGFRLSIDQPGLYVLRVEAPGFVPLEHRLEPLLEDLSLPEVRLERDLGLSVQVRGPEGRPLADALVSGSPLPRPGPDPTSWRRAPRTAVTGRDGRARLSWSPGEGLAVRAFRADLGESLPQIVPPAPRPARELTLILATPHPRRIRVLDRGGKPRPGVAAYGGDGRWSLGQTGDDGSLTLATSPGRPLAVELQGPDGSRGALRLAGGERGPVTVTLAPPARLTGRLVSARDGTPIRRGLVWPADHPALFTRSEDGGGISVPLADGSRQVAAAAGGFAPARLSIPARELHPVIVLEPVRSLAGRIVDDAGRPVAGAEVRAFSSAAPLQAVAATFSDAGGGFRLSGLPSGHGFRVEARREGYGAARREMPAAPGSAPAELVLVLRSGRIAFGSVRDPAGRPVRAARVLLVPEDGAEGLPAVVSDASGVFHLPAVPPGAFTLSVRAPGFAPLVLPGLGVPAGTQPWDLGTAFLVPGAAIEGRVVRKDGSPVSGAHVRVLSRAAEEGRPPAGEDPRASTDGDGRFTLADQAAGSPCRLEVSAEGFLPVLSPEVAPPTAEPVTVVLSPSGQISGTVLADGGPVAGAVVVAEMDARSPRAGRRFYTTSEADGGFLLRDVEPGGLILSASAEGYQESSRVSLLLPAGERRDQVELHLEAGGTVTGEVSTKQGTPLAEAVVEAFAETGGADGSRPVRRAASSDPAGRFRLSGLSPGSWLFTVSHPGFARGIARQPIGGGEPSFLEFVLDPGAEVAGTAVDADGAPVPGARVRLSPAGRGEPGPTLLPLAQEREVASGADGSFLFTGVEDGSYRLLAAKAGFAPAGPAEPLAVSGAPVTGLVLRLARGSSIGGRLLGLAYDELVRVEVYASRTTGQLSKGEVGPDGSYRLPDLEPGPWWVVAEVEGTGRRITGQVTLTEQPASLDLDFTRAPAATGNLSLRDP